MKDKYSWNLKDIFENQNELEKAIEELKKLNAQI